MNLIPSQMQHFAYAQNAGPDEAVEQLFNVLDSKVRYQEHNKILKSLAKSLNVNPGSYNDDEYTFENEENLKKALVDYVKSLQAGTWR